MDIRKQRSCTINVAKTKTLISFADLFSMYAEAKTAVTVRSLPSYEPRREKTGLRGFRPGPTQTGLYKLRKELEA